MIKLIIRLTLTVSLLFPITCYAQKNLLDSLDEMTEIANKIIREQKKVNKNIVKHHKKQIQPSSPQLNVKYNFTLEDALGGPSLNDDPVVKKARAKQATRESQNTLSSNSITPENQNVDTTQPVNSTVDTEINVEFWFAVISLILGVFIWYFWARDYNKGKQDPMNARRINDSPLGCLPWLIAFAFVGLGIYLLAN